MKTLIEYINEGKQDSLESIKPTNIDEAYLYWEGFNLALYEISNSYKDDVNNLINFIEDVISQTKWGYKMNDNEELELVEYKGSDKQNIINGLEEKRDQKGIVDPKGSNSLYQFCFGDNETPDKTPENSRYYETFLKCFR